MLLFSHLFFLIRDNKVLLLTFLLFLNQPFCLSSTGQSAVQDPKTATVLKHQKHESHLLHERNRQSISSEIRFVQRGNTFSQTNCCSCKVFLLIFKCAPLHWCLVKVFQKSMQEIKIYFGKSRICLNREQKNVRTYK